MTTTEHPIEQIAGNPTRMTEEEFEAWAIRTRTRAEWVEGEVIFMSPVSYRHNHIFKWLLSVMNMHAEKHQLGEVNGSELMNRLKGRRRLPDIFFVARGRESLFTENYFDGPADLIVEIVSPESQSRDRREKYLEYQTNEVREYWIIDPMSQRAEFYELRDGKYVLMAITGGEFRSTAFTGFWLRTEWLWQQPLPTVLETAKILGII